MVDISNPIKRVTLGTFMVSGFSLIIWMGPWIIILLVLVLQIFCFHEILTIGYRKNQVPKSVHVQAWYFHLAANYFCAIETLKQYFPHSSNLIRYHRFIAFCLYFFGIILFVLSLVKQYRLQQFKILAWTHTLLIIIVVQSYLLIDNVFQGLIWVLVPVSLVIINDIFAYVFGRLIGKTPLIEVSPKKTWEGFIAGIIGTIISGYFLSYFLCQYLYFVCPIEINSNFTTSTNCTPSYYFIPNDYHFYPFMYHFLVFALFASIIAPFGGFAASGFKRAFKIKDFGDAIPGHGGIMDRFDCQFLMATFVHVYIFTFIKTWSVDAIFNKVLYLENHSQVQFYFLLKEALHNSTYLDL